jgi:hypothetical protein
MNIFYNIFPIQALHTPTLTATTGPGVPSGFGEV